MSLSVLIAVLGAALLHASWNAMIKLGGDKMSGMLILTLVQGALGALVALGQPLPQGAVWWWLAGSGVFHSAYKFLLALAYQQGDLSRVYPIARGAAPLVVLLVGPLLLTDRLAPAEYLGVLVLGTGILLMARGVFRNGESRRLLPFALGSALATAGYSLVDGMGARVSGNAAQYVAWLFILDALLFGILSAATMGRRVFIADRRGWALGAVAATASYGAYAVAVWAMTVAPIALVAALRETSILFAVLIGWALFGERIDRAKALAAVLIVGGVALTRL